LANAWSRCPEFVRPMGECDGRRSGSAGATGQLSTRRSQSNGTTESLPECRSRSSGARGRLAHSAFGIRRRRQPVEHPVFATRKHGHALCWRPFAVDACRRIGAPAAVRDPAAERHEVNSHGSRRDGFDASRVAQSSGSILLRARQASVSRGNAARRNRQANPVYNAPDPGARADILRAIGVGHASLRQPRRAVKLASLFGATRGLRGRLGPAVPPILPSTDSKETT
jgi:hypothetical protein